MDNSQPPDTLEIGAKVREARKKAGLTLRELASAAQISASMLSQIENGRTNSSVQTLYNLAALLEVPMDYFFPDLRPQQESSLFATGDQLNLTASEAREVHLANKLAMVPSQSRVNVLSVDERPELNLTGGVHWSRLTAEEEKDVVFLEIVYEPGASSGLQLSHHRGREFGMVLHGELQLQLGFDEYTLGAGDTIIFNSEIPHRLLNNSQEDVRAIWVIIDRPDVVE